MPEDANKAIIQGVSDHTLTLNVNGAETEISKQPAEFIAVLKKQGIQTVQYAEKVYNIGHINEANFGMVTGSTIPVFNEHLTRRLIDLITSTPEVQQFLEGIPIEDQPNWEKKKTYRNDAQQHIEDKYVWVIRRELSRLFATGKEKNKPLDIIMDDYIKHCISISRLSLQLLNFLMLSRLWDAKKKNKQINTNQQIFTRFFSTRPMKLKELRTMFQQQLEIFREYQIEFPCKEEFTPEFLQANLDPESDFNKAYGEIEALSELPDQEVGYGLGHCHTAEISIATILTSIPFFTTYQLVTMKKVEYEETRNASPRYVKDFTILETKQLKEHQRFLKYDSKPSLSYALFFHSAYNVINLFPFLLDYSALVTEVEFQLYCYVCRHNKSGLKYWSQDKEKEDILTFSGNNENDIEVLSEGQKNEMQKKIRLDLAIRQFEDAMNTILDSDEHFIPVSDEENVGFIKNI